MKFAHWIVVVVVCCATGGIVSAGVITLNTDTGAITGQFGTGTAGYSYSIDTTSHLCRWTFSGDLNIDAGTQITVIGSNMVSLYAQNDIRIGYAGSGGVFFDVSAKGATAVAGGGAGGAAGLGGASRGASGGRHDQYGYGGRGGLAPGGDGLRGDKGPAGNGTSGYTGGTGGLGGLGAGGVSGSEVQGGLGGNGGIAGYIGRSGSGGDGGAGGLVPTSGTNGGDGEDGTAAGHAGNAAGGKGGVNSTLDTIALTGGNGGSGGGGGGAGGAGGGGGAGGTGGGGGASSFVNGNDGGRGGDGGNGGNGGAGGQGGTGGAGGGALELVAGNTLSTNSGVQVSFNAAGSNGQGAGSAAYGKSGQAGLQGDAGALGGKEWGRGWGGDGGTGGMGGHGGNGGYGACGGGGAGGTIRLAGTVVDLSAHINVSGGGASSQVGLAGALGGQNGKIVVCADSLVKASIDTYGGTRRDGTGADVGLHVARTHDKAGGFAPRIQGLVGGGWSSGLEIQTASELGYNYDSNAPVLISRRRTSQGVRLTNHMEFMIACGQETITSPKLSIGGQWYDATAFATGDGSNRQVVDRMEHQQVYSVLLEITERKTYPDWTQVVRSKIPLAITYSVGQIDFAMNVSYYPGAYEHDADGFLNRMDNEPYDEVVVRGGEFRCGSHARYMYRFGMADAGTFIVKISGSAESGKYDKMWSTVTRVGGKLVLDFTDYTPQAGETYEFIVSNDFTPGWEFDELEVRGLDAGLIDYDMASGSFSVVPEPATLCILAFGGMAIIRRRKR